MHGDQSPDAAQLGLTRWLAAVALAVSAIALLVMIAMAWSLTPAQQKHDVEQARARDAQARASVTRQTTAPGRANGGQQPEEPETHDPAARTVTAVPVKAREGKARPIGVD